MIIERKMVEQITITGLHAERAEAYAYCTAHGYRVTESGPRRTGILTVDVTQFRIVAKRELEQTP